MVPLLQWQDFAFADLIQIPPVFLNERKKFLTFFLGLWTCYFSNPGEDTSCLFLNFGWTSWCFNIEFLGSCVEFSCFVSQCSTVMSGVGLVEYFLMTLMIMIKKCFSTSLQVKPFARMIGWNYLYSGSLVQWSLNVFIYGMEFPFLFKCVGWVQVLARY